MSWLFSQALVEASSADSYLDGTRCAPSKLRPTPQAYCVPDRMTDFYRLSRFGMTFAPLTERLGEAALTWCLADSLARTLAQRGRVQESAANDPAYGLSSLASLAKFDHPTSSWRTAQSSLLADLDKFLETWPRWGLMRDGVCWELQALAPPTSVSESGLWQTPVADDAVNRAAGKWNSRGEPKLSAQVLLYPTPCARDYKGIGRSRMERTGSTTGECLPQAIGGLLNPTWAEWLMGWPLGWTELKPSATARFPNVQQQHGDY